MIEPIRTTDLEYPKTAKRVSDNRASSRRPLIAFSSNFFVVSPSGGGWSNRGKPMDVCGWNVCTLARLFRKCSRDITKNASYAFYRARHKKKLVAYYAARQPGQVWVYLQYTRKLPLRRDNWRKHSEKLMRHSFCIAFSFPLAARDDCSRLFFQIAEGPIIVGSHGVRRIGSVSRYVCWDRQLASLIWDSKCGDKDFDCVSFEGFRIRTWNLQDLVFSDFDLLALKLFRVETFGLQNLNSEPSNFCQIFT